MPKLSTHKISKKFVDSLPASQDAIYFDSNLKGFAVRIKPSGTKTYLVQYRNRENRTRKVSIGQHGVLTPDQARIEATKLLSRIALGADPANERDEGRIAMTISQLCDEYFRFAQRGLILGKKGLPKKQSTLSVDQGRVKRHIVPLLGSRKVKDLTTTDINRFMRDVATGKTAIDQKTKLRGRSIVEGGNGTAARTVGLLGGIFSFAVSEGIIPHNPCRGVKRPADQRKIVRLSSAEYGTLGKALKLSEMEGEAWQSIAITYLLALTGCRRSEIINLKWDEIDFTQGALRFSDTKTGKSIRPLSKLSIDVLKSLKNNERFVFPAPKKIDAPYGGYPKAWKRILGRLKGQEAHSLTDLTPHGLRHAFASQAGDLGFTEITIAGLIGHATATVTGRYIHTLDSALLAAANDVALKINVQMDFSHGATTFDRPNDTCSRLAFSFSQ